MSNIKNYKYDWIWEKGQGTNFALCKKQPLKNHEIVSVFYFNQPTYHPQMNIKTDYAKKRSKRMIKLSEDKKIIISDHNLINKRTGNNDKSDLSYPKTVQYFASESRNQYKKRLHPTQKPLALMEYLIKTYTNENETVLDFTMGSGSTGVAAKNLNRNFIGIEQDDKYFNIASERINKEEKQLKIL